MAKGGNGETAKRGNGKQGSRKGLSSLLPFPLSPLSLFPSPWPLLAVDFRPALLELFGLLLHAGLKRSLLVQLFLHGVITHVLRDLHRTKVRTTHGTEVRHLRTFRRQGLVVKILRRLRIERQVELILPAKLEPRL